MANVAIVNKSALLFGILAAYAVRDEAGQIDLEETCGQFASDLIKFQAERETETSVVAEAVNAVFSAHPGAKMNMPYVTGEALKLLNVQPETFKLLTERVQVYIRDNNGDRPSGKLFHIGKGKGGGVCRWSDCPLTDEEKAEAAKAAAAAPVVAAPAPESTES